MAEKRVWWRTCNEFYPLDSRKKIPDQLWKELYDLANGFQQLAESCSLALSYRAPKWKKKFMAKMIKQADRLGRWKKIAEFSERGSPEWMRAFEKIWHGTIGKDVLYRWREMKRLLPKDHAGYQIVVVEIRRLRKKKRARSK